MRSQTTYLIGVCKALLRGLHRPDFIKPLLVSRQQHTLCDLIHKQRVRVSGPLSREGYHDLPPSSDDWDFAFFADLTGDGSIDVDTGGIPVWAADATALLCL